MEPSEVPDLRADVLEASHKTVPAATQNASSLHRVRTQNRK